eukprot:gene5881-7301_t
MFASLKSLLGGASDPNFPFTVEEIDTLADDHCFWNLRRGTQRSDGKAVSIFELNKTKATEQQILSAQHAVKRLKTVRHPNVLVYLGSSETPNSIFLATEKVVPLKQALDTENNTLGISWGLYQIAVAFLSESKLVHGNISLHSIFVNEEGDWKLAGFERLAPSGTNASDLSYTVPEQYRSPEGIKGQTGRGHPWSTDMWGFGCLVWEVHNGPLKQAADLKQIDSIPKLLLPYYINLVSANPRQRPKPSKMLEEGRKPENYFKNDLIDTNIFLGELAVKEKEDVQSFYQRLPD